MIVTEEEAKKRACCKIMPRKPGGELMTVVACLASVCMGWRWMNFTTEDGQCLGFCGLAGVPFSPRTPIDKEKEKAAEMILQNAGLKPRSIDEWNEARKNGSLS